MLYKRGLRTSTLTESLLADTPLLSSSIRHRRNMEKSSKRPRAEKTASATYDAAENCVRIHKYGEKLRFSGVDAKKIGCDVDGQKMRKRKGDKPCVQLSFDTSHDDFDLEEYMKMFDDDDVRCMNMGDNLNVGDLAYISLKSSPNIFKLYKVLKIDPSSSDLTCERVSTQTIQKLTGDKTLDWYAVGNCAVNESELEGLEEARTPRGKDATAEAVLALDDKGLDFINALWSIAADVPADQFKAVIHVSARAFSDVDKGRLPPSIFKMPINDIASARNLFNPTPNILKLRDDAYQYVRTHFDPSEIHQWDEAVKHVIETARKTDADILNFLNKTRIDDLNKSILFCDQTITLDDRVISIRDYLRTNFDKYATEFCNALIVCSDFNKDQSVQVIAKAWLPTLSFPRVMYMYNSLRKGNHALFVTGDLKYRTANFTEIVKVLYIHTRTD